jgi:hypothetical protein
MRRRAASIGVAFLLSAAPLPSGAAPDPGEYVILGAGSRPCGSWLRLRSQPDPEAAVLQSWVLGYITSVNANVLTKRQDIADGKTVDGLFGWVDSYCAAHPLDSLARATGNLLESLRAKSKAQ